MTCPSNLTVWEGSEHHRALPPIRGASEQPDGSAGDHQDVDPSSFVLIVDDDPDLLDATSFVLENEGIVVETARNGQEALAVLRARRLPELVLLDLMMPVMNGWEFLEEVAKDPVLKALPVVVLTAAARTAVPGATEVLSKPMDLMALLRVVERYVRGEQNAGS